MSRARLDALLEQWEAAYRRGEELTPADLCRDCPELLGPLMAQIAQLKTAHQGWPATPPEAQGSPPAPNSLGDTATLPTPTRPQPQPPPAAVSPPPPPAVTPTRPPTDPPPAEAPTSAPPGYEIMHRLGSGGMGVVYKVRQVSLNRPAALKMILSGAHAHPQERARFLAEAEAVAALAHPGVVQVYECGTHAGQPYFVLEFCPGGSLAAKLGGAPLPPPAAATLVEQLARAVQAAHERGIVHRDLKPANVLLAADGTPKVTDFGLAKRIEGGPGLTRTGVAMGTPCYMAPEQARGAKTVGPAADVWALGAILYECLTGRPPFRAATEVDTMIQVVGDDPVPPSRRRPGVPRDLESICLRCLEKDPARRYPTAGALAEDLRRFQAGELVAARPVGAVRRGWRRGGRWLRRNPLPAALLLLLLAGFVLMAAAWWGAAARQRLVRSLHGITERDDFSEERKSEAESLLDDFYRRDPAAAAVEQERYVDWLLSQPQLTPADLHRVDRATEELQARAPEVIARVAQTKKWQSFFDRTAPFVRQGSIIHYVKRDPERTANLRCVLRVEGRLHPDEAGVSHELLRAYFVAGQYQPAMQTARDFLDRPDVAPVWRMTVLRDYVWLAIFAGSEEDRRDAGRRVEALLGGPGRPESQTLLVERAQLLAAQEQPTAALATLDTYFSDRTQAGLDLQFHESRTTDARLGEGPPTDNIPVLHYLDACLLRGFLLDDRGDHAGAAEAWAAGFKKVRRYNAGTYYEAAVLGSLAELIDEDDAIHMAMSSLERAGPSGTRAAAGNLIRFTMRTPVRVGTEIVRRAWRSTRGRAYARAITYRRLGFRDFCDVQMRLWVFEALRMGVAGEAASPDLTGEQSELLVKLVEGVRDAYAKGDVSEQQIVGLVKLVMSTAPYEEWQPALSGLPDALAGPLAYVLGRHAKINLRRPQDAKPFFQDALRIAPKLDPASPLRPLAESELR